MMDMKEGMSKMKNLIKKYLGAITFYSILICGILLLNMRFEHLNHSTEHETVINGLAYQE